MAPAQAGKYVEQSRQDTATWLNHRRILTAKQIFEIQAGNETNI
jgi:hypothetical protein